MSESAEASQRSGTDRDDTERRGHSERGDRRVGSPDRRLASVVKKMAQELQELATVAEEEAIGQLLAAIARIDGETTQSGILNALLEEGRRFASRTAFFLTRPGEVRGWAGLGFSGVEGANIDAEDDGVWARMSKQTGALSLDAEECAAVCRSLGAPAGCSGVLIPFTLRGQLGGVLYADCAEGENALGIASLQLLTYSAAQTVETAAVRGGGGSTALHLSAEAAAEAAPVWHPPEAEEAAAEPETSKPSAAAAAAAVAGVAAAAGVAAVTAPAKADEEPALEESEAPAEEAALEVEPAETAVEAEEPEAEEAEAEVEEPAAEVAEPEAAAKVAEATGEGDDDEAVDFEMVTTPEAEEELQTVQDVDIEAELEPEPELEDTSDLWTVEEEPEEEEATYVGSAPTADVEEPAMEQPPAVIPPEVGQETVRLDIAALQGQIPGVTPPEPAAEEETTKLPQWEVEPAPEPASQEFELEPEEEPAAPAPDYGIEVEEPATTPMAAPDFSEDATMISPPRGPAAPSPMAGGYVPPAPERPSTEVTPPADMAPSQVAPPADMAPSQVAPPADMAPSQVAPPADMAPSQVAPPADMAPSQVAPPADMEPSTEVTPPPSSGFAAPPPAQKADAGGTSQVVPPTDIQGPGSAFGAASEGIAIPEGEEALHEEARRLARLLVSEIKLYNEEIIEEGRRSGNIYDRLKDDIDRSCQMYEERIDPRLLEGDHDYFRQELVQRLAGGDQRLLGY